MKTIHSIKVNPLQNCTLCSGESYLFHIDLMYNKSVQCFLTPNILCFLTPSILCFLIPSILFLLHYVNSCNPEGENPHNTVVLMFVEIPLIVLSCQIAAYSKIKQIICKCKTPVCVEHFALLIGRI